MNQTRIPRGQLDINHFKAKISVWRARRDARDSEHGVFRRLMATLLPSFCLVAVLGLTGCFEDTECETVNPCGGCDDVVGEPGDPCGDCGVFVCDGPDTLVCIDQGVNACGGCSELEGEPGDTCGDCGVYVCESAENAGCSDPGLNVCGGCSDIDGEPGSECGACGVLACDSTDSVACFDDPGPNGCGIIVIEPPSGFSSSRAMGINADGMVVGNFFNIDIEEDKPIERQAFLWTSADDLQILPTISGESSGWAINDHGLVSGFSMNHDGERRATMWDVSAGTITDVGTFETTGAQGTSSDGYGINNNGVMVGMADVLFYEPWSALIFHAFSYNPADGIRDLGTLTTEGSEFASGYSMAYSLNNHGQIVGIANDLIDGGWMYRAFIYDESEGMQSLPIDPDVTDGLWYATTINDVGLIGGHCIYPDSGAIPQYWLDRDSAPVQVEMPEETPFGEFYGMNEHGEMVGMMFNEVEGDGIERAFYFSVGSGLIDLNDLLHPDSDWILEFARDINESGQIVGTGTLNGHKRGFVLDFR